MVSDAEQGGRVGMKMCRRNLQRTIYCAVCSALIILAALGWSPETLAQSSESKPEILLESSRILVLRPKACLSPMLSNVEARLNSLGVIFPLPAPIEIDGRLYEWRIGNDRGTTYWHREFIDVGRYAIRLYIRDLNLHLLIVATSISYDDHPNILGYTTEVPSSDDGKTQGTSLNFLDLSNGEGMLISFWSRRSSQGAWDDKDRNVRVRSVVKQTVKCS
jgi:hypothetical protein